MSKALRKRCESVLLELKRRHDQNYKENFFDVQIYCQNIILPAHRYVLSTSSLFLAGQLSSGVDKLDWTEFEEQTCIALLRWIYTNTVAFSSGVDVTVEQWQDLLLVSYTLQLVSLFTICEQKLLTLLDDVTSRRLGRFRRLYGVAKKVGAVQVMQKCVELRLNVHDVPREEPDENFESLEHMEAKVVKDCFVLEKSLDEYDQVTDEQFDELLMYHKLTFGFDEFKHFADMHWITYHHVWRVHQHIFGSRSSKLLEKLKSEDNSQFQTIYGFYRFEHIMLRWIYTDCVVFDNIHTVEGYLEASQLCELPALFEICEDILVEHVDITQCAYYHQMAVKRNASKIAKRCVQVFGQFFNQTQSLDCPQMSYELKFDDPVQEMEVCESLTEADEGLLLLNDDCLLHIFRFVSRMDLGSIKGTCKRFSSLADQSFRILKDKSLVVNDRSMFADIWILKHFGKFFKSLIVESFYERYAPLRNILELIAQCTGEELKSLSFHDCDEKEGDTFDCLKPVLKKIECIELQWFEHDSHINSILGFCENLREVCIGGDSVLLNSDWCLKNVNVTTLTMSGLTDDSILEKICKTLTRLESLSLYCVERETNKIFHLGRLSHLRKLKVESSMIAEALQQFTDKTVLEDLTLHNVRLTGSLANVLGEFPNLSNLIFESGENFGETVQHILSEKLINIKTISFVMCEITSKAIIKIIRNVLGLKSVSVSDCSQVEFIDREDYLRLDKMKNLQVSLDKDVYLRSCELIGNNLRANVQVQRHQEMV